MKADIEKLGPQAKVSKHWKVGKARIGSFSIASRGEHNPANRSCFLPRDRHFGSWPPKLGKTVPLVSATRGICHHGQIKLNAQCFKVPLNHSCSRPRWLPSHCLPDTVTELPIHLHSLCKTCAPGCWARSPDPVQFSSRFRFNPPRVKSKNQNFWSFWNLNFS